MVMDLKTIEEDVRRISLEVERCLHACSDDSSVVLSRRGSVRGRNLHVFNTVNRWKARNLWKRDYVAAEEGKVIVYTTTCGVIQSTFKRCREATTLLQNLNINAEYRDLNIDGRFVDELLDRLRPKQVDRDFIYNSLPLIYVNGYYFGNDSTLQQWNEEGKLSTALQSFRGRKVCSNCNSIGYTLCRYCNGSKRSPLQFLSVTLRCGHCDPNGLVVCPECLNNG